MNVNEMLSELNSLEYKSDTGSRVVIRNGEMTGERQAVRKASTIADANRVNARIDARRDELRAALRDAISEAGYDPIVILSFQKYESWEQLLADCKRRS